MAGSERQLSENELTLGAKVFTRDGAEVGTVKEVGPHFFKVEVSMRPDFWLQNQFIEATWDGGVRMEFDESLLDDYKVSKPEDAVVAQMGEGIRAGNPEGGLPENTAASTIRAAEQQERLG